MQFLNKQIEALAKRRKTQTLIKKQVSCGIFQDMESRQLDAKISKDRS